MELLINVFEAQKDEDEHKKLTIKTSLSPDSQTLVDPLNQFQHALVRWYLEEHPIHDPLEKTKASLAETELERYGQHIAKQIGLSQEHLRSANEENGINLRICQQDGDTSDVLGFALHWEALEGENDPKIVTDPSPIVVSRLVTPSQGLVRADAFGRHVTQPFRILIVVARQDLSETHHRIVSTALQSVAATIGPDRIEVDIVRPGTFAELKNQLEYRSGTARPIDLVHFDLHGEVKEVRDDRLGSAR